jgi:transposase
MRALWQALDERFGAFDREFAEAAAQDEHARRLLTIPGLGSLNATALVAAVGDARGRDLAAWLGLVPRRATTGGKPRRSASRSVAAATCASSSSREPSQPCRGCAKPIPGSAPGFADRLLGRIPTPQS